MGYKVVRFQETPNPNALKCVLDRPPPGHPKSYFNADQATGDPLGSALFGIGGVTNVLIGNGWITVNKAGEASWKTIRAGVERVLRDAV